MYNFKSNKICYSNTYCVYSRLGFEVTSPTPNFEKAWEQFHYELGKSKKLQKQTIGLQCYLTIPRRVTILHDNRIEFNEFSAVYKDLNEVHHKMIGSHMNILIMMSIKS